MTEYSGPIEPTIDNLQAGVRTIASANLKLLIGNGSEVMEPIIDSVLHQNTDNFNSLMQRYKICCGTAANLITSAVSVQLEPNQIIYLDGLVVDAESIYRTCEPEPGQYQAILNFLFRPTEERRLTLTERASLVSVGIEAQINARLGPTAENVLVDWALDLKEPELRRLYYNLIESGYKDPDPLLVDNLWQERGWVDYIISREMGGVKEHDKGPKETHTSGEVNAPQNVEMILLDIQPYVANDFDANKIIEIALDILPKRVEIGEHGYFSIGFLEADRNILIGKAIRGEPF